MGHDCTCEHCEAIMQPFLDRELSAAELAEAEAHLQACSYCRKRFHFEETLRGFVKKACCEDMSPELKERLQALRLPAA